MSKVGTINFGKRKTTSFSFHWTSLGKKEKEKEFAKGMSKLRAYVRTYILLMNHWDNVEKEKERREKSKRSERYILTMVLIIMKMETGKKRNRTKLDAWYRTSTMIMEHLLCLI